MITLEISSNINRNRTFWMKALTVLLGHRQRNLQMNREKNIVFGCADPRNTVSLIQKQRHFSPFWNVQITMCHWGSLSSTEMLSGWRRKVYVPPVCLKTCQTFLKLSFVRKMCPKEPVWKFIGKICCWEPFFFSHQSRTAYLRIFLVRKSWWFWTIWDIGFHTVDVAPCLMKLIFGQQTCAFASCQSRDKRQKHCNACRAKSLLVFLER